MKHLSIFLFGLIVLSGVFAQSEHPLRKTLESIYAAHAQGDIDGALQYFEHPNFVLDDTHPPTPRSSALYGVWPGKEGLRQWLTAIGKNYQIHSFVHNIVSLDDKGALVHALVDESCRSTGKRLAQPVSVYHRYYFEGEQIVKLDVYHPDAPDVLALCRSDVEEWLGTNLPALVSGDAATLLSPNATVVVRGRADSPLVGQYDGATFFQALAASDYHEPTFELVSSEDLKVLVELNYSKWSIKTLDAGKRVWRNLKAFVVYQLEKVEVPAPAAAAAEQVVANETQAAIETGAVEPAVDVDAQVVASEEQAATPEPVQVVAEPQFTYQVASVEWMWASGDLSAYAQKKKHGKEHKHQEKEKEEPATEEAEQEEEVKESKTSKKDKHAEKEAKKEKEKEKEKGKKDKASKKEEL